MDFNAGLMPLETALTQMLDRISPLQDAESLPLVRCFGRIAARDIVSPLNVPGFDNSAMDGYAVRLADLQTGKSLPVAGKAFAGQPFSGEWPEGTCVRIMTGAPVMIRTQVPSGHSPLNGWPANALPATGSDLPVWRSARRTA